MTYSYYGLSRDSHSAVMLPLLPPLHRRAGRCDGPHSYAAFLARGSATSKLFNMRGGGGGGAARRIEAAAGPFKGEIFRSDPWKNRFPLLGRQLGFIHVYVQYVLVFSLFN